MTQATAGFPDAWLADYLTEANLVPTDRLAKLVPIPGQSLWQAAVDAGLTSDAEIAELVSRRCRVPIADLGVATSHQAVILPESTARKFHVLVLDVDDRKVTLATADPRNIAAEQALGFITGRDIQFAVAGPGAINDKLDEIYRPETSINRLLRGLAPTSVEVETKSVPEARDPALDAPMSRLVDAMIADAVRAGASDIHSELEASHVVVRYRVDGILKEVMKLPEAAGPSLVRRVKIIAGLDVTNSMTPQDGRSSARVDGQAVDLRVATAPVARKGEKLVIRILNKSNLRASIPDLLLPPDEQEVLLRMLGHREGMLLVTGPTGSGKTTTLYAVLNHLKTGKVNIVTVEDPVEYDIDGISQMQVNEAQGFTFATALRSVLRQDPDIVLVGEIRDVETATIATQAGLTGHYVFATLHTNDAVAAIVRMRDMGVEGFKLGTVLKGVVAQRLVRRLCERCAEPIALDQIPSEARPPAGFTGRVAPRSAVGCKFCSGSGYKGRLAVMELLPIEGPVPGLIESGAGQQAILDAARPFGLRTLWESGLVRFWSGVTSYDEVRRVLGESRAREGEEAEAERVDRQDAATAKSLRSAAEKQSPTPAPPLGTDAKESAGLSVLLADDDAQMRKLIRMVLEREGFKVIEAADGLDALELLQVTPVDLVLLDQEMPRLTGLGVLEELRAHVSTATLPVIMLTAAQAGETETQAFELGATDYLTKPVQPRSLVARVKAVLKRTGVK